MISEISSSRDSPSLLAACIRSDALKIFGRPGPGRSGRLFDSEGHGRDVAQPPVSRPYPPPPYGPYGPPVPYPVPPPRTQDALIRTILVLVIVAIALLALVVFAFVSLFGNLLETPPRVAVVFTNLQMANGNGSFAVATASERWSPSAYAVNVIVDSIAGTSRPLATSGSATPIVVGSMTIRVVWSDVGGDGTVSPGDVFAVQGDGLPLPTGHSFVFYLIWSATGSIAGSKAWTT